MSRRRGFRRRAFLKGGAVVPLVLSGCSSLPSNGGSGDGDDSKKRHRWMANVEYDMPIPQADFDFQGASSAGNDFSSEVEINFGIALRRGDPRKTVTFNRIDLEFRSDGSNVLTESLMAKNEDEYIVLSSIDSCRQPTSTDVRYTFTSSAAADATTCVIRAPPEETMVKREDDSDPCEPEVGG